MSIINPGMSNWNWPINKSAASGRAITEKRLNQTLEFIEKLMYDKKDKGGKEAWKHCYRTFLRVNDYSQVTEAALHAALLHDSVEDNLITLEELWEIGYPWKTLKIVEVLTRYNNHFSYNTYQEYIEYIVKQSIFYNDPEFVLVKLSDIYDNMSPERDFPGREKLIPRYEKAKKYLISYLEKKGNIVKGN